MTKELQLPKSFTRRIVEGFGTEGQDWLARLSKIVETCARRWSLTVLPHYEALSYNYVAPVIRTDGVELVLKVGVPNPELWTEMEALTHFAGHGSVQLLEVDLELGAMLLERLKPGMMLVELEDDQEATSIVVQVMKRLWCSPPEHHNFLTVNKWAAGLSRMRDRYNGGTGPLPVDLVVKAESLFSELIESMDDTVLLHGDLHHYNILSAVREPWLALDPKGVIGEAAYEVGAMLRNPYPQLLENPDVKQITTLRVDQLAAELGFERQRIIGWGFAQAVLSAWWSVEDHNHGWEYGIRCAEILSSLF
jgi:streptomycin 6-kinase